MRADEVVPKLRAHLDRRGYDDIEIRLLAAYEVSKTSINEPIVQAVLSLYRKYGVPVQIQPHWGGSAAMCYLTSGPVYLPLAEGGLGHGGNPHATDEYLVIEGDKNLAGLVEAETSFVDLLYIYAETQN
jgi:acetylornithine deacetylase/succinyl-diaminopimelate desuccinylase-like protein